MKSERSTHPQWNEVNWPSSYRSYDKAHSQAISHDWHVFEESIEVLYYFQGLVYISEFQERVSWIYPLYFAWTKCHNLTFARVQGVGLFFSCVTFMWIFIDLFFSKQCVFKIAKSNAPTIFSHNWDVRALERIKGTCKESKIWSEESNRDSVLNWTNRQSVISILT